MVLVDSTHSEQATRLDAALGPVCTTVAGQGFTVKVITYKGVLAIQVQIDAVRSSFPQVPLIVLVRTQSLHFIGTLVSSAVMAGLDVSANLSLQAQFQEQAHSRPT